MGGKGEKFPREEAEKIALNLIKNLDGVKKFKICGSIRRRKEEVGDIDIVFVLSNVDKFNNSLKSLNNVEVKSEGYRNIRLLVDKKIQVDIVIVPENLFESAALYFTGSKYFNIRCRLKAKSMGYKLNEYGLWDKKGNKIAFSEKGILEKLNMSKYLDPTVRF